MSFDTFKKSTTVVTKTGVSKTPSKVGGFNNFTKLTTKTVTTTPPPTPVPTPAPTPAPNLLQKAGGVIQNIIKPQPTQFQVAQQNLTNLLAQTKIPTTPIAPKFDEKFNQLGVTPTAAPSAQLTVQPTQGAIDNVLEYVQRGIQNNPDSFKWLGTAQKFTEETPFIGINKNPLHKAVVQGFSGMALGSSQKFQDAFNQRLIQPVTFEDKVVDFVGQGIGGVLMYMAGGAVLKAAGLTKAMLPVLFATLGQTSAPPGTTTTERMIDLPIDALTGYIFGKIPMVRGLNRQALKSVGLVSGTLGGTTLASELLKGRDPKEAAKLAGEAALVASMFYVAGNAIGLFTDPRIKSKSYTATPDQIRQMVYETNSQGNPMGKGLIDLANKAEVAGKNVLFNATDVKQSILNDILNRKTVLVQEGEKVVKTKGKFTVTSEFVEPVAKPKTIPEAKPEEKPPVPEPAPAPKPPVSPVITDLEAIKAKTPEVKPVTPIVPVKPPVVKPVVPEVKPVEPVKVDIASRTIEAEKAGKAAFDAGKTATPAQDPALQALLKDVPVGQAEPILKAWTDAWHKANVAKPVEEKPKAVSKLSLDETENIKRLAGTSVYTWGDLDQGNRSVTLKNVADITGIDVKTLSGLVSEEQKKYALKALDLINPPAKETPQEKEPFTVTPEMETIINKDPEIKRLNDMWQDAMGMGVGMGGDNAIPVRKMDKESANRIKKLINAKREELARNLLKKEKPIEPKKPSQPTQISYEKQHKAFLPSPKKVQLPILATSYVKDGKITSTNLTTALTTDTNLEDGLYQPDQYSVGKEYIKTEGMSVEDFPTVKTAKGGGDKVSLPPAKLTNIMHSVSKDESRPVLQAVQLKNIGGTLYAMSTDGYRLSVENLGKSDFKDNILIPVESLKLLQKFKVEDVQMSMLEDGLLSMKGKDFEITSRLTQGEMPHIEKIYPDFDAGVVFDKAELENAIKVLKPIATETANVLRLQIGENTATLTAGDKAFTNIPTKTITLKVTGNPGKTSKGVITGTIQMPVRIKEVEANPDIIGLNDRYMADAIKSIEGDKVYLDYVKGEPLKPVHFSGSPTKESVTWVEKKPVRQPKGGYGDVGGYANVKSEERKDYDMKPVEMPELVRMAKQMLGSTPSLKRFRKWLGVFHHRGQKGDIALDPRIFKDPEIAATVLAHEMGHAYDWLDKKTMNRGNILGHIAALKGYMKHTLPPHPGAKGELTPADRARLQREAEKASKQEIEVTEDIVVDKKPVDPKDVLLIWNDVASGIKDPKLTDYIKRLDEVQKKQIAIAAMKGKIPKWVTFLREVTKTITRKVIKNSPADIRALYLKLVKEEINKRMLFDYEVMRDEVQRLSVLWKPFTPIKGDSYTKYRFSPAELYADTISVMLRDPWLLKRNAPNFYKAYLNYMNSRPHASDIFKETWNLLNESDEAVYNQRNKDIDKMFESGETANLTKELEKNQMGESLAEQIRVLTDDRYFGTLHRTNKAIKGGAYIPAEKNPIYGLHSLAYLDSPAKNYILDHVKPIYDEVNKLPGGMEELGKILLYERAMTERGQMANPMGHDPKTAADNLARLEKSYTPEEWQHLQNALKKFREMVQSMVDKAAKEGFYKPETLLKMKMNPAYATFQVIDYLDTYISPQIYQQVGTLKDVTNPATATVMKMISIFNAIERNKVKKLPLEMLAKNSPDEIEKAKTRWNGRTLTAVPPKDSKKGLVVVVENGSPKGYYVPRIIADSLKYSDNTTIRTASRLINKYSLAGLYRELFVGLNPGFQSFNVRRDFDRYWKAMPDENIVQAIFSLPRALYRYGQALPHAYHRGYAIPDTIIRKMEDIKALGLTSYHQYQQAEEDDYRKQIERIAEKGGVNLIPRKPSRIFALNYLDKMFEAIFNFGSMIESLPKVAAYIERHGKIPDEELAEFIRTKAGSPDFRISGTLTPMTNPLLLFSNAIKEGLKTDSQMAFTKNESQAGYIWKTVVANIIPHILMFLIALGYLGKTWKQIMDSASEYDKTNYNILPLGLTKTLKGIYNRIPQDESGRLVGGITWKLLNMVKDKKIVASELAQLFDFGAGQFPNLNPGVAATFPAIGAIPQYLSGRNPYDYFRGQNIIPDTEFNAGWKRSLPIFLDWLAKQQGLTIILPKDYFTKTDPTSLEKFLNLPVVSNILGRWIKVSDYGITEQEKKVNQEIVQQKAEATLQGRELLDKALKDYKANPGNKKQILNDYLKTVVGGEKNNAEARTKSNAARKKFEIGTITGTVSRQMDSLISASTNDFKLELMKQYKQNMSQEDFRAMWALAVKYKVFSAEFIKQLRIAKLY